MRIRALVALSSVASLSACGSSTVGPAPASPVPAGAVAAAGGPCLAGPPASRLLNTDTFDHDGVVGAIYNQTGQPIYISYSSNTDMRENARREVCRLDPGQRAAYAGNYGTDGKPANSWAPPLGAGAAIFASSSPDLSSGTVTVVSDPSAGYPIGGARGFSGTSTCAPAGTTFSENEESSFDVTNSYGASGKVVVKRLKDDKGTAKEWTGHSGWQVNDWARMDINIYALGSCTSNEEFQEGAVW